MRAHHQFLAAAALAAGLLSSAPSSAQMTNGLYFSGGAGANWLSDATTTRNGVDNTTKYKAGPAVAFALGYGLGNGIRLEGELGYRNSDVNNGNGSLGAWTFMGNGLYDFDLDLPIVPYLGVGLGAARLNADAVQTGATSSINDSDTRFAYQGIAGAAYAINERLKLDLSYRYLGTTKPTFTDNTGASVKTEYNDHAVLLSFRYEFGAPKPMAQPAAAPAPAPAPAPRAAPAPAPAPVAPAIQRSYLVFFDFDKSDITPEANRVIQQAATNAKSGSVSRIQATGHADRAGPDRYNMALSIRRANAVKAVLVRNGIPESQIVVIGKGETEPLVPTPDGVREPQNRRVEILLQ